MNIKFTEHCINRCIERVKKINTEAEARKYLKDKFTRLMSGEFKGQNIRYGLGYNGSLYVGSALHRFIYSYKNDVYHLITYHIYKHFNKSPIKEKKLKWEKMNRTKDRRLNKKIG